MLLSIVGVFKMALMIVGGLVVLRFLGQLMVAKRNLAEDRQLKNAQREFEQERAQKLKNFGKVEILKSKETKNSTHDVEYEEVK